MTQEDRIAALEARCEQQDQKIAQLQSILGAQFIDKPLDPSMFNKANELPNGRYPYFLSDYQLRLAFAALVDSGGTIDQLRQAIAKIPAQSSSGDGSCPLIGPLPPSFQWPTIENGFSAPAGSGGPSGPPAEPFVHRGGFLCIANVAEGSDAQSGPNGQAMGIDGRSKGKIRVNSRGGAEGDGGMRDTTNWVELQPRPGVGTITRSGYDIYCSEPDAISIETALWTRNPDGKMDGGVFIVERKDANHFIGNWSDPALDYVDRPFIITGADQPDRDRYSVKSGADSNGGYGWRVAKPRNSTENHAKYEDGGFDSKGDFFVRLHHDNGSEDYGRYSRFKDYNRGRGQAFATSVGIYGQVADVLRTLPGANGNPGGIAIACNGGPVLIVKMRGDGSLYCDGEAPPE